MITVLRNWIREDRQWLQIYKDDYIIILRLFTQKHSPSPKKKRIPVSRFPRISLTPRKSFSSLYNFQSWKAKFFISLINYSSNQDSGVIKYKNVSWSLKLIGFVKIIVLSAKNNLKAVIKKLKQIFLPLHSKIFFTCEVC